MFGSTYSRSALVEIKKNYLTMGFKTSHEFTGANLKRSTRKMSEIIHKMFPGPTLSQVHSEIPQSKRDEISSLLPYMPTRSKIICS